MSNVSKEIVQTTMASTACLAILVALSLLLVYIVYQVHLENNVNLQSITSMKHFSSLNPIVYPEFCLKPIFYIGYICLSCRIFPSLEFPHKKFDAFLSDFSSATLTF